jgi:hypothetical protein
MLKIGTERVSVSPMPGNFGQFGSPRQFGLPAGQFCFINRAICTEENRFQVGIPKMLKMGTEGPSVPDARQCWAIWAQHITSNLQIFKSETMDASTFLPASQDAGNGIALKTIHYIKMRFFNYISWFTTYQRIWDPDLGPIAAPRLRPLFKDKQIVEGSDGCGLFVDNLIFLKIVLFCVFYRVLIGLCCFNLRIMNPDLSGLRLLSFLFQCVKVAATIYCAQCTNYSSRG